MQIRTLKLYWGQDRNKESKRAFSLENALLLLYVRSENLRKNAENDLKQLYFIMKCHTIKIQ